MPSLGLLASSDDSVVGDDIEADKHGFHVVEEHMGYHVGTSRAKALHEQFPPPVLRLEAGVQ